MPLLESGSSGQITLLFVRLTGLYGFTLLWVQIMLGAFMPYWMKTFGPKALKLHFFQGSLAYLLIFTHPLLQVVQKFFFTNRWDFLGIYLPNLSSQREQLMTVGRVSLYLLTITVLAGKLRNQPWLKKYWRVLHSANYFIFFFVLYHSLNLGTDTQGGLWKLAVGLMTVGVLGSVVYRLKQEANLLPQ